MTRTVKKRKRGRSGGRECWDAAKETQIKRAQRKEVVAANETRRKETKANVRGFN